MPRIISLLLIGIALGAAASLLFLPGWLDDRRQFYAQALPIESKWPRSMDLLVSASDNQLRQACRVITDELRLNPQRQGGGFDLLVSLDRHIESHAIERTYRELGPLAKLRALSAGPSESDIQRAQSYADELYGHTRDARVIADWANYCATIRHAPHTKTST